MTLRSIRAGFVSSRADPAETSSVRAAVHSFDHRLHTHCNPERPGGRVEVDRERRRLAAARGMTDEWSGAMD